MNHETSLDSGLAAVLTGVPTNPNGTQPVSTDALANLAIARDDARNYIVLGDPAARLRIKDMM